MKMNQEICQRLSTIEDKLGVLDQRMSGVEEQLSTMSKTKTERFSL